MISKSIRFLKEAYVELTKVTWLGRKEAFATTVVVVVFLVIMALFVTVVDTVISFVLTRVL
jgi:preprotein translocase subunit SecE